MSGFVNSVETFGTVDGPGIRYIVFLQGCPLRCKFCHNRDSWKAGHGKKLEVSDLLSDISKYKDYYHSTGGGVTASGGEPLLQPDFVRHLFKGVKELGLNTALDTSGYADPRTLQTMIEVTDLILLSIKAFEPKEHLEITGVRNEKIQAFTDYLKKTAKPVWLRYVLLPGINDDHRHLMALVQSSNEIGNVKRIEVLGYHKLGVQKWEDCGEEDPLQNLPAARPEVVEEFRNQLRLAGISNVY